VVPSASISVNRNYDFDFVNGTTVHEVPYRVSKPAQADPELLQVVRAALEDPSTSTAKMGVLVGTLNASTDSFYSSQGRITSFPDHNAGIIDQLKQTYPDLATFEMETFHLFHQAASWPTHHRSSQATTPAPPVSSQPAALDMSDLNQQATQPPPADVSSSAPDGHELIPRPTIRAAAVQMVFAARGSRDMITPAQVEEIEDWCASGVLEALSSFEIVTERLHPEAGSVWEKTK